MYDKSYFNPLSTVYRKHQILYNVHRKLPQLILNSVQNAPIDVPCTLEVLQPTSYRVQVHQKGYSVRRTLRVTPNIVQYKTH